VQLLGCVCNQLKCNQCNQYNQCIVVTDYAISQKKQLLDFSHHRVSAWVLLVLIPAAASKAGLGGLRPFPTALTKCVSLNGNRTSTPFHANGTRRAHHFMRMAPHEHTISCEWHHTSTQFHANGTAREHHFMRMAPYEHTTPYELYRTSTQFHRTKWIINYKRIIGWVPYECDSIRL
jgi:hypothetical protein